MSGDQRKGQQPAWETKSGASVESPSNQHLSREEFMTTVRQAANANCPSRAEMISEYPNLENENTVNNSLDIVQKALGDDHVLMKRGEAQISAFRKILEPYGLEKLPLLLSEDVTEIGRASTQTEKRCLETRIGRTS